MGYILFKTLINGGRAGKSMGKKIRVQQSLLYLSIF